MLQCVMPYWCNFWFASGHVELCSRPWIWSRSSVLGMNVREKPTPSLKQRLCRASADWSTSWFIVVYHGLSRFIMVYHGLSRFIMVYHGLSWFIMVYHGLSWFITVYSWFITVYYGLSWFIMVYSSQKVLVYVYHFLSFPPSIKKKMEIPPWEIWGVRTLSDSVATWGFQRKKWRFHQPDFL